MSNPTAPPAPVSLTGPVRLTDDFGRVLGRYPSAHAAKLDLERSHPGAKLVPRTDRYGRFHWIVKAPEPTFANLVHAKAFYLEPA